MRFGALLASSVLVLVACNEAPQQEQLPAESAEEGLVSCPSSQGSANPSALVTACWSLSNVNVNGKLTCIANGGGRR